MEAQEAGVTPTQQAHRDSPPSAHPSQPQQSTPPDEQVSPDLQRSQPDEDAAEPERQQPARLQQPPSPPAAAEAPSPRARAAEQPQVVQVQCEAQDCHALLEVRLQGCLLAWTGWAK